MKGDQRGPVSGEERPAMHEQDLPFALWDLFPDATEEDAALLEQQFAGLWAMARLLEAPAGDADLRLERASLLLRFGRAARARKDLMAARFLAPSDPRPFELLVSIELREGDAAAAGAWVDELLVIHPRQWWGHYLRLLIAEVTGAYRWQEDVSADRLLELLPDDPDTWRLVALADIARGRTIRARRMIERTLAARPDDVSAAAQLLGLRVRPRLAVVSAATQVAATHPEEPVRRRARRTSALLLLGLTGELALIAAGLWAVLLGGGARDQHAAAGVLMVTAIALVPWWRRRGRRIRRPLRMLDHAARATPVVFALLMLVLSALLLGLVAAFVIAGNG